LTQPAFTSEDDLSEAVKKWLDRLNEIGAVNTVHFHVPNEFVALVNRIAAWAKKLRIGCLAGAPDWVIAWCGGVLFLELKHAKTMNQALNKMSDQQKDMAALCQRKNIPYAVVHDKESFMAALNQVGVFV
jgi:hypothetical protein